jgi:hypothetical protein
MTQQNINVGTGPDSYTGESLRTAFQKVNDNFSQLYAGNVGANISGNIITANGFVTSGNVVAGNVTAAGNISAYYFIGDGSHLTGVTVSANTGNIAFSNLTISGSVAGNIVLDPAGDGNVSIISDVIPGANVTYNLGSSTRQWKDLWLSNSTLYLGGFPITVSNTGALSVNGSPVTSSYGNANVTAFLPTYTGAINSLTGNVTTTANVQGAFILGNGSQLTGLGATYSNTNVASYLPTYTGNIAGNIVKNNYTWNFGTDGNLALPAGGVLLVSGGITAGPTIASPAPYLSGFSSISAQSFTATGNITANTGAFFIGNGSQLTGISGNIANITANVISFNTAAGINVAAGQMAWNSSDGTLDIGLSYADVVLQVGQETHYVVRNDTGNIIENGTAVYCSGVTAGSGRIEASPMTGSTDPIKFLGLATQDISNGVNGVITYFGYVRGLDTRGTANTAISVGDETWAVGDQLYVHPTAAGKLTNVEPAAPNVKICVASIMTRNQTSGVLFVRPTTNLNMTDLSDVQITTPATNQFLVYVGNRWENTALDISLDTTPTLGGNLAGAGFNVSNVGNISATGNITAQNFTGNINITGNVQGTSANVTLVAGSYDWTFDNTGNLTLPGNTFAVNYADNTPVDVVTRFEGSWTVPTGNSTQSFTVTPNNTYNMWVEGNIPNGIIVWNATATITNTNVPVAGVQYAWVYNGGGTPIDFTSIPNQFEGTANTIVRSNVAPSTTTNRFDFGINNTSGNTQVVRYGWIKIS